jgi:hypothetical protein
MNIENNFVSTNVKNQETETKMSQIKKSNSLNNLENKFQIETKIGEIDLS